MYGWLPNKEMGEGNYESFLLYKDWEQRLPDKVPKDLRKKIEEHLKGKADDANSIRTEEEDELSNMD